MIKNESYAIVNNIRIELFPKATLFSLFTEFLVNKLKINARVIDYSYQSTKIKNARIYNRRIVFTKAAIFATQQMLFSTCINYEYSIKTTKRLRKEMT